MPVPIRNETAIQSLCAGTNRDYLVPEIMGPQSACIQVNGVATLWILLEFADEILSLVAASFDLHPSHQSYRKRV